MNWQKEITLKDVRGLFRRSQGNGSVSPPAAPIRVERSKHKELVGLKVGASQLAAAQIVNNGSPRLRRIARDQLAPGIVVGGEVRDHEALAAALVEFFERHELPPSAVRLGIANNRIGVRAFELDGIDDAQQLDNAIRFRSQDLLPIPLEDAVIDYHVVGESVRDDGAVSRRIVLVVAHREVVDGYMRVCEQAGLGLVGIDLEAFGLLRALSVPRGADAGEGTAVVGVSIGHERTTFAVSDGRICEFARVLTFGGAALTGAVVRALGIDSVDAESVKHELSLADASVRRRDLTDEQAKKAADAMRRELQSFARELLSSLHFYQSQPGSLDIGEVIVTGGSAGLRGLAAELERLLGVPVRAGDPLARVEVGSLVTETDHMGSLTVAIGLGIED